MTAPQTTGGGSRIEALDWRALVKAHGRKLALAGGSVFLVAAAVWLWATTSRRKEAFAGERLTQARSAAEAGNLPLAASDLSQLIERFGGTRAADDAVILLNQIRLIQGQRDVAVSALQQFVRMGRPDDVTASAYGLLGGGLEDQGKPLEAGEAYRQAAARARLDYQQAQFLLDAGRALAAGGDTGGAKQALTDLLTRFPETEQTAEARVRLAELGGEAPEAPAARRR